MKPIRGLLSLIIVVAVVLASTVSVSAIGFEAETAYESVLVIRSGNSLGSGFAVGENCIVTNAHVVENVKRISVTTYGGTEYQASVFGINEEEDIAVLVVRDVSFPYFTIADLSAMKTGDDIYTIGAPKGMAYTLTKGGISAKERMIGRYSYIQIDAPINEGNSGGPLLNDAGEVLGMNTLKISDSEGIGFAIPISRICNYLTSLGIKLSTNGNVSENIEVQEGAQSNSTENKTENENKKDETNYHEEEFSVTDGVLYAITCMSLLCNIVLIILLIYQKKKNITMQYDPRERTDFDIDVWE